MQSAKSANVNHEFIRYYAEDLLAAAKGGCFNQKYLYTPKNGRQECLVSLINIVDYLECSFCKKVRRILSY